MDIKPLDTDKLVDESIQRLKERLGFDTYILEDKRFKNAMKEFVADGQPVEDYFKLFSVMMEISNDPRLIVD